MADSKRDSSAWKEVVTVLESRLPTIGPVFALSRVAVLGLCEYAFQRGYRAGRRAMLHEMKKFVQRNEGKADGP